MKAKVYTGACGCGNKAARKKNGSWCCDECDAKDAGHEHDTARRAKVAGMREHNERTGSPIDYDAKAGEREPICGASLKLLEQKFAAINRQFSRA